MKIDKPLVGEVLDTNWDLITRSYNLDYWLEEITKIINSDPSVNIAITGDWGTGKTTFLRAIERYLRRECYPVVFYEAWRYQKDPDPLLSMLQTIERTFEDEIKIFRIIRRAIDQIYNIKTKSRWEFGLGLKILPIEGKFKVSQEYESLSTKSQMEIFNTIHDLAKQIKKSKKEKPLILIVDDIDRLMPHRAYLLLEELRFYFYTSNIVVFMGVNESVLANHIRIYYNIKDHEAQRFLDKIFNFRIRMGYTDVNDYHMSSLVDKLGLGDEQRKQLRELFNELNKSLLESGFPHRTIIKLLNNFERRILVWRNKCNKENREQRKMSLVDILFWAYIETFWSWVYSVYGNKDLGVNVNLIKDEIENAQIVSIVTAVDPEKIGALADKTKEMIENNNGLIQILCGEEDNQNAGA